MQGKQNVSGCSLLWTDSSNILGATKFEMKIAEALRAICVPKSAAIFCFAVCNEFGLRTRVGKGICNRTVRGLITECLDVVKPLRGRPPPSASKGTAEIQR